MKTITFYSYKGGVGRSLALANVANRLSEFGKKVCILDFDLEAPGQHLKFSSHINHTIRKKGLVDYIHEFTANGLVPDDIRDYVTPVQFAGNQNRADINLIVAGNTLDKNYWRKLSSIDWNALFYGELSQGVAFFLNLKAQIETQLEPDFLLIDSRTGITDISGITMSIFADEVVLLAANNRENMEGISQVVQTLADPANSLRNQTPKIHFILSRIPYFSQAKDKPKENNAKNQASRYINNRLARANINHLRIEKVLVIHSDPSLELKEEFKISYGLDSGSDTEIPIGLDYLELFEELTSDVITPTERSAFNDFIQVELLIEKANTSPDPASRIRILKSALLINPNSSFVLANLGIAYHDIKDYQQALDYIDKSLAINPLLDDNTLYHKGNAYIHLKEYNKAQDLYESLLKTDPEGYTPLIQLGNIYYTKKEYDKALELHKRLVDLYPDDDNAWNAYGNNLRVLERYEEAMVAIYEALQCNPQNMMATGTLAEIYAALGNIREFYKNLELAFTFGMDTVNFQRILEAEDIYRQFYNDEKFLSILSKYNIDIDWLQLT